MTFDVEQTAREFEAHFEMWHEAYSSQAEAEVTFTSWADQVGLTAEQQRAVRRESDLLEAVEE